MDRSQDFIFWDEREGADNLVVASYIRAFHVVLRLQPKVNKVLEGRLRELEVAASQRRRRRG